MTYFSKPPENLGVVNGRLADPPMSPNCVTSQVATDRPEYIEPLKLPTDREDPIGDLAKTLNTLPRVTIISKDQKYLHAECRSLVLGFVDDLEFLRDDAQGVIQVRSASRMGHSDLGVNRARVERIRKLWDAGS
ncbi:MAG: DUF1499 domain-containing protein [Planctomycetaceae bacterium]|nr:DUF1499 domain-containing protein [Planctomycetaceae bacterium]